jgi:hypothetical protein
MPDDNDLNFEGKITNKDVREILHIPVFITKSINNNNQKKEENSED